VEWWVSFNNIITPFLNFLNLQKSMKFYQGAFTFLFVNKPSDSRLYGIH